jgi:hypothetical protein
MAELTDDMWYICVLYIHGKKFNTPIIALLQTFTKYQTILEKSMLVWAYSPCAHTGIILELFLTFYKYSG